MNYKLHTSKDWKTVKVAKNVSKNISADLTLLPNQTPFGKWSDKKTVTSSQSCKTYYNKKNSKITDKKAKTKMLVETFSTNSSNKNRKQRLTTKENAEKYTLNLKKTETWKNTMNHSPPLNKMMPLKTLILQQQDRTQFLMISWNIFPQHHLLLKMYYEI